MRRPAHLTVNSATQTTRTRCTGPEVSAFRLSTTKCAHFTPRVSTNALRCKSYVDTFRDILDTLNGCFPTLCRARERIRTRGFKKVAAPIEGKPTRGGVLVDSEPRQLGEEGVNLLGYISAKTEGVHDNAILATTDFEATQVWHTTARHDPEVSACVIRLPHRCSSSAAVPRACCCWRLTPPPPQLRELCREKNTESNVAATFFSPRGAFLFLSRLQRDVSSSTVNNLTSPTLFCDALIPPR